jgi:transposase
VVAGERDRPDVARRRAQWLKYQDRVEAERPVFIDETWTRTDMAALRRWAPRGQRLPAKVAHGRWKTMTFLAALRHDRIEAPWFIEGPIDGDSFRLYVEKVLLPTLRPGDIVVMDNLGSHRSKTVRHLIRSVGAKLFFLPKYSPDLNPIEQVFAKLKHFLRKAAARTVEAVCFAIGEVLQLFTPEECASYLVNSGYRRT